MRIFVGAVLACAALASTAPADTYCVSPATGCDHTAASIQNGLNQAASHAGDDTVQLGAALYNLDMNTGTDSGGDDGARGRGRRRSRGISAPSAPRR